jgi:hypothetical protein
MTFFSDDHEGGYQSQPWRRPYHRYPVFITVPSYHAMHTSKLLLIVKGGIVSLSLIYSKCCMCVS